MKSRLGQRASCSLDGLLQAANLVMKKELETQWTAMLTMARGCNAGTSAVSAADLLLLEHIGVCHVNQHHHAHLSSAPHLHRYGSVVCGCHVPRKRAHRLTAFIAQAWRTGKSGRGATS